MAERLQIDLFCEDFGHEIFATALIKRMAGEASLPMPAIQTRAARGGHGRAISELKSWQRQVASGRIGSGDLLLVLIDANSENWKTQKLSIEKEINQRIFASVIVACPEPHIEAWCAADPEAFQRLFSCSVPKPPKGTGRLIYKKWLQEALEASGETVLSDPMEIALDFVPQMDLYRSGKACPSLGHLIKELSTQFSGHGSPGRP